MNPAPSKYFYLLYIDFYDIKSRFLRKKALKKTELKEGAG
jgi:sulfur relay (sulfurtransferase) DsrF/TusC family protein